MQLFFGDFAFFGAWFGGLVVFGPWFGNLVFFGAWFGVGFFLDNNARCFVGFQLVDRITQCLDNMTELVYSNTQLSDAFISIFIGVVIRFIIAVVIPHFKTIPQRIRF